MGIKEKLRIIIFGANTRAGRLFDIFLLWIILISILLIMLESITALNAEYSRVFKISEWIITGAFTLEYLLRIWVAGRKKGYALSFFGIVDLLSILPSYIALFFVAYHSLIIFRAIRLLRVFRIFQLTDYLADSARMGRAMIASLRKIIIFLSILIVVVMIFGTLMFVVEGPANGYTSIPQSIFWAIVTITTVGSGNLAPVTVFGKFIESAIMLLGYAIIAVPTGIMTAEFVRSAKDDKDKKTDDNTSERYCHNCGIEMLHPNANFCRNCGHPLRKTDSAVT